MKKITFLAAFFAAFAVQAQHVLFEDDFESYDNFIIDNVGDWTLIDMDGAPTYGETGMTWPNAFEPQAYIVFNANETTPAWPSNSIVNWEARSGNRCMTAFASVDVVNNDWLISPPITLGSSGNELTFWAKAAELEYSDEKFHVGISTTGTDPFGFTFLAENIVPEAVEWEEFTFDLDNYAGQTVWIAINHVADDQFGFQIDDFKVTAGVLGIEDTVFAGFNQYTINNTLYLSSQENFGKIAFHNALGQQVLHKSLTGTSAAIDLNVLQTGIYIATVGIQGAEKSFRVLVK